MMRLAQAAEMLDAKLVGNDVVFNAVNKDTRTLRRGDLYVAIKGERFDGHSFIAQAAAAGAVGTLVSEIQQTADLPQIVVADTRLALGKLAAGWRRQLAAKVVAITGSNGKTTVKEMCRSILMQHVSAAQVLSTQGNLNNDIGVPLTLLALRAEHQFAVIEMGANHVGEINYLTHIARPDVALVNNAGAAHIEGFGSLDNIAHAKAEIYSGLGEAGIAIINLDDNYAPLWLDICKQKTSRTFSFQSDRANVHASEIRAAADASRFVLHVDANQAELTLPLPGQHNIMNVLAATAVCTSLGVSIETVVAALYQFSAVGGRLNLIRAANGARMIDDTYNANPQSFNAAMQVLIALPGKAWLAMGDMGELGPEAKKLHRALGVQAKTLGIQRLFAVGELSREAVSGFGENAQWFSDHAALAAALKAELEPEIVLLVKGSRFMAMEKVVKELVAVTDNKKNNSSGERQGVS